MPELFKCTERILPMYIGKIGTFGTGNKMDIIERLRQNTMLSDSIEKEAADEIERLREALSTIAATDSVNKINPDADLKMMWIGCTQIARSALNKREVSNEPL